MRSHRRVGIATALAAALFVGSSPIVLAQRLDEANELNSRLIELFNAGRYADATPMAQRLLAIRERTLSPDHPDVASALNNLATLYYLQRRYADAEPLYLRALAIREKALRREHPDVVATLNNLAALYESQRRYADAESLYQRALAIRERTLGRDHPDIVGSLKNLVGLYHSQGRYADALPLAKRVLAVRERTLGRDDPLIAASLNDLAVLYYRQGSYVEAEPLWQRALAIREKVRGRDHPDVAMVLESLALLYGSQGRYADAAPLHQRALAIRERALGRDHPDVGEALNNLGELYRQQGRYADAAPLHQRALLIFEGGRDEPHVARSLNNLGKLYVDQGRYADAEPLYQQALAILQRVRGRDHPDVAAVLTNLGGLYLSQGRYAATEPLYQQAFAIREKALGRDHPDVAESLNNLAELYRPQGRYADAEPLHQRALAIWESALGRDHPNVGQSLSNLASLYTSQGRYADAELLFQRAVVIKEKAFGRDHPNVATSLNNLAELHRVQGRYTDAEPLLQRALAIRERAFGRDHVKVAATLHHVATLHTVQGRYAAAEPLFKRALAILEEAHGRDHSDVAVALNDLAWLYQSQGRYTDAEPLWQRALATYEKVFGRDHPHAETALDNLAGLYDRQGRYADALPIIRRTKSQGAVRKSVAFPVLFQSQAQRLVSATQALADSYEIVQRASSSVAANAVSKLAARFAAGTSELAQLVRRDQDLATEAEGLDKAVVAFLSKPPTERSAPDEARIRKRIEDVKAERARLSEVFNQRFPEYVALSRPQPVPLAETQALLADDEALLVFDFDAKSYAWIITRTDADWTELKVSSDDLDAKVQALRAGLTDPRGRFDPVLAYEIYQATFGAFGGKIAAKKRLSIVTNGALTSLPPHLLVTTDPSGKKLQQMDWLVRSHALTILPSVASLKVLRGGSQTSSARRPMIAFADPVFSKSARRLAQKVALRSITSFHRGPQVDLASLGEYLPQLPGSRKEVTQIAAELKAPTDDIRLGLAATETAVKQAKLDQYRIVYFATHGLVSGQLEHFAKSKAEPALALSIPDKPNDIDDGLLTASEIAQLKLDADWVVLSACNTAAEDRPGAEALSGLARAFFYAGAKSLIVSHWSVSDEATARLMIATFRAGLRDPKLSHAEALRQAMLTMIDTAPSDAHASPLYWAPFVVVGEPAKPK